jgi:hypothetical protein
MLPLLNSGRGGPAPMLFIQCTAIPCGGQQESEGTLDIGQIVPGMGRVPSVVPFRFESLLAWVRGRHQNMRYPSNPHSLSKA